MPAVSESKYLRAHWHKPERLKTCIRCRRQLPLGDFSAYGYVTNQGKPSTRYESRCKPCNALKRRAQIAADPEKCRRIDRASKVKNGHKYLAKTKAWRESEHGRQRRVIAQRLRRARARARLENKRETDPHIRALYAEGVRITALIQCCPVWDLPELQKAVQIDHITPISKGGKHEIGNLRLLPKGLNLRKGSRCQP